MKALKQLLLIAIISFWACGSDTDPTTPGNNFDPVIWLVPPGEIFDGGPGKDGIPSVDDPQFSSVSDIDFLGDNDLVVGILHADGPRAYPHVVLDWHEIVNDEFSDLDVAVTYCPLTGTAIGWNRLINGSSTTFGVSGKLYNTTLIPYDRATDSYWSQIRMDCINGELIETEIDPVQVVEMSWKAWKALFPDSRVMNTDTGFNRNYGVYPYGDYKTDNQRFIFPVDPFDDSLLAKERALGVFSGNRSSAYSINLFDNGRVINDQIGDEQFIIAGSREDNFMVAFKAGHSFDNLVFDKTNYPVIAVSDNGEQLSFTGAVLDSEGNEIDRLEFAESFVGFWFSLGGFYPRMEVYE